MLHRPAGSVRRFFSASARKASTSSEGSCFSTTNWSTTACFQLAQGTEDATRTVCSSSVVSKSKDSAGTLKTVNAVTKRSLS